MKLRIEPITLTILAILAAWGWNEAVTDNRPICQVEEIHNGQIVLVPKYCEDVLTK